MFIGICLMWKNFVEIEIISCFFLLLVPDEAYMTIPVSLLESADVF